MSVQQLMNNLLEYVVEQSKSVNPAAYNLRQSDGFKKYKADLTDLPGIECDVEVAGDHLWLQVQRLREKAAPQVTDPLLRQFVVVSQDPAGSPPKAREAALAHRHATDITEQGQENADLTNTVRRAAVAAALESLLPLWQDWSIGERPRRRTMALYGDLFALKFRLEAEESRKPWELVWGIGIAAWSLPAAKDKADAKGTDFVYPLLTQAVELSLDQQSHALSIRPRAAEPRLEFDAFSALHVAGVVEVERAAKQLLASGDTSLSPFDASSYEPILKQVLGALTATGRYHAQHSNLPTPDENLLVTGEWVILERPRANNYLVEDIARLKSRVSLGDEIPPGPLGLVTPPSDEVLHLEPISFRGLSGPRRGDGEPRELYFPKPYNAEQEAIVEQLERSPGVVVQGPPGTGKTHTIANIICHYLATGRKVLVTSRGEPALAVLKEKIPESVQPLTVALLSGDREGMRQLQSSIEIISNNLTNLIPRNVEVEIERIRGALDQAHAELLRIDQRIDAIAEAQLRPLAVDGVEIRPQGMAELVVSGEQEHGWFDDELTLEAQHAPPLTHDDVAELRRARRALGDDIRYVDAFILSGHTLPSAVDIGRLHHDLVRLRAIDRAREQGNLLPLRAEGPEVLGRISDLVKSLEEAEALLRELDGLGHGWAFGLRERCRSEHFATERSALRALFEEAQRLMVAREQFMKRPVEAPTEAMEHPKARLAIERAAETGKPFGLLSVGLADVKPHVNAIRVAGLPPVTADDWQHVRRYVGLHAQVLSYSVRWNQFAELLGIPRLDGGIIQLRNLEMVTRAAEKANQLAELDKHLARKAQDVLQEIPLQAIHGRANDVQGLRLSLQNHLNHAHLAGAMTAVANLLEKIASATGTAAEQLSIFVKDELGQAARDIKHISARYADLLAEVRRIERLSPEFSVVRKASETVEAAGAIYLARRIRSVGVGANGEDRVLPVRWREAWTWARMRTHLDQIEARAELLTLASRRSDLDRNLARLYEDLVSKSAWLSTKNRATPRVVTALEAFRIAMRKIGQGTGINAERHRRDAQRAMSDAQDGVPCWIMSHARVSETLPAKLGAFDLVIVDEASQSDLWALPAILRAKRVLVVGDDKQVSPDAGFMASARIQELYDRHLAGQPFAAQKTPDKSLYDLASTVFASSRVMLREHFRCVPSIIAYSNRVFYKDLIQPLRIPRASERIDPPLVDVYVINGIRSGKDINVGEADFVVAEIKAILDDPAMMARTLGVVSLLGPEQARYIDERVRAECDANELLRRHFACGDARVFQGSERDIMFLSLVADSREHKALSGNMFDQRFNVAASRARDRMYLVRSVRLDELSLRDLRRGLLEHFNKPMDAADPDRNLIDLCESQFEKQVYGELVQRGYRVTPQVKSGAFRIDMVVEGDNDTRLAIECDGDDFHGPDRWPHDMSRQRVLERAGWVFWRCFASTWVRRKEAVLDELLARLAERGITPVGATARTPKLVEFRKWGEMPMPAALDPDTSTSSPTSVQEIESAAGDLITYFLTDDPSQLKQATLTTGPTNLDLGLVSVDTPLGATLQGTCVGESVVLSVPGKSPQHLTVQSIQRAGRIEAPKA